MSDDPGGLASDHEVEITAEDIERAKMAAERDGSPLLNAMLNAEAEVQVRVAQIGRCGGGNQA